MPFRSTMVLSGGVALGAYQAGAYAVLHAHRDLRPTHFAASSVGAVNAALIVGGSDDSRVERLRAFWDQAAIDSGPLGAWLEDWSGQTGRYLQHRLGIMQARMLGRGGLFRPRVPPPMLRPSIALYDSSPMRATLSRLIDFDRLRHGSPGISVVTTDIETGERVVFDTRRGQQIGVEHLLASSGFLPDFEPLEIEGRLLGDGGLVANAPVEEALADDGDAQDLLCFVLDLFNADGSRPRTLEQAAGRRWDLVFGNQTRERLKLLEREYELRALLAARERKGARDATSSSTGAPGKASAADARAITVLYLSHRPRPEDVNPGRPFDFSRASLRELWAAGELDMTEAIRTALDEPRTAPGLSTRAIRRAVSAPGAEAGP